jgi:3',5'-cyclic AMP phosphodiesterase CpdA
MPDASLTTEPPISFRENSSDRPTHKSWTLTLPDRGTVRLVIGPEDAELTGAYRFAVLSDVQEAVDDVGDIFDRMNTDDQIRFVLSTGDLTETGERGQFEQFKRELQALDMPLYSTVGNHDTGFDQGDDLWHEEIGRHTFHFDFKGVAFSMLDSASATLDPIVYDWLDRWLALGQDETHIVLTHIPAFDPIGVRNGAFRSRREAAKLVSRLAQGDVDLTLYGHIHSYYTYSHAGIPAFISGGGGAIPETMDGVGRHYLTVDVSAADGVGQVALVRVEEGR